MAVTTFYSVCAGLTCYAGKTQMMNVEGTLQAVDPPLVKFSPFQNKINGKQYGTFQTEDPDIIEYLNKRAETAQDVITGEDFARRIVPADVQVKALADENRKLAEENRLLRALKEQQGNMKSAGGK